MKLQRQNTGDIEISVNIRKLSTVKNEMKQLSFDILEINEFTWIGTGHLQSGNHTVS